MEFMVCEGRDYSYNYIRTYFLFVILEEFRIIIQHLDNESQRYKIAHIDKYNSYKNNSNPSY